MFTVMMHKFTARGEPIIRGDDAKHTAVRPFVGADTLRVDTACRVCSAKPLTLRRMSEIVTHGEHEYAVVGCVNCESAVGTARWCGEPTVFGEDEDQRMASGRFGKVF